MPGYTTLPSDWQTELEKVTGANYTLETVIDPDGSPIILSGKYDIVSMSPIMNIRDLNIEWSNRPTASEFSLVFNDPDNYFSPRNSSSPFYNGIGELDRDHFSGATEIKILNKTGLQFSSGTKLKIDDGTNSEYVYTDGFTASSGSTYYHSISITTGLTYGYKAGTYIFVEPVARKEIEVKIKMTNCDSSVTLFRGRILKSPETSSGKATIFAVDLKKYNIDELLLGADSGTDKIKRINTSGTLDDSVYWNDGSAGTLNREDIMVLTNSKLGTWIATFTAATTFNLACSDQNIVGLEGNTNLEVVSVIGNETYPLYISTSPYSITTEGYYAFVCTGYEDRGIVILDYSNPANPQYVSSMAGYGFPNYLKWVTCCAITGSYLYAYAPGDAALSVFDISDISSPTHVYSLTGITSGNALDVVSPYIYIVGDYIYLLSYVDGLKIIDISSRELPVVVGSFSGYGAPNYMQYPRGMATDGDYVYIVSNDSLAFLVIDVRTKSSPTLAGSIIGWGAIPVAFLRGCTIKDDSSVAYIVGLAGYFITVDISDKTSPSVITYLASADPPYLGGNARLIYRDERCYFNASQDDAIQIINVSDSSNPTHADAITGIGAPNYLDNPVFITLMGDYLLTITANDKKIVCIRVSSSDTNIIGSENIRIPNDAWGGAPVSGDVATFATAINFDDVNISTALVSIYEDYSQVDSRLIDRSSFFGNRNVGTLYESATASDTEIKVKISVPMLIKTSETLILTEGSTTEEITVSSGVDSNTKYPPYITLTVSALSNSYSPNATVVWKSRAAYDSDFSFDKEYHYFDICDMSISMSLDRQMTRLQAIEEIVKHGNAFTFSDNWGVEKIHVFRPQYYTGLPEFTGDTNILANVSVSTMEMVNEIEILYGYDYINSGTQYSYIYPEGTNKSGEMHGFTRRKTLSLPGIFTDTKAKQIAAYIWNMWQAGFETDSFSTTIQGLVLALGDSIDFQTDYPNIDTYLEIFGIKGISLSNGFNISFVGYDAKRIWGNYFIVGVSGIGTGSTLA